MNLKEALQGKLTGKELERLRRSFDTIGTIAIIEIPPELRKKQKLIAQTLLTLNPHIKTVLKKAGAHTGKFRTQKLAWLAGERTMITEHKESGVRIALHVQDCYFSPRLSTERLRIAQQVKKGEKILCLFSGVAPYPLVLAKATPAALVVGIEMNPTAHRFAAQNVALNNLAKKIALRRGDARKVIATLAQKFDRIIMPLPKSAGLFLEDAFKAAKRGTVFHLYGFAAEEDLDAVAREVLKGADALRRRVSILKTVKCGPYSPRTFRVCVDFRLVK